MRYHAAMGFLLFVLAAPSAVLAQEAESGSEGSEAPAVVDAWQEAETLRQAGDYQAAADRYQQILAAETHWKKQQKAALMAGQCLDQAGSRSDAIALYDQVIAIADQQQAQGDGSVMFWPQVALAGRAFACEQRGDVEGARYAIERLKVEYPKSDYTLRVLEVQARLDGRSPEAVRAYEEQALALAEQVSALVKADQKPEALALVEQILSEYPGTAAVYPALRTKALVLWGNGDYRGSRATYEEILTRCRPVAPHCRLVRTAEYRVAWLESHRLFKDLVARKRRGQTAPDSEWLKLQNACAEIVAKNPNPQERADARMIALQGLCWQGKNEQTLAACEQFLREFAGPAKLAKFPVHVAWAHLIAGISLERLGRHTDALDRYEWIVQPRPGQPENWAGDEILPVAHYRIWHARWRGGAADNAVTQAAQDLVSRFPSYVDTPFVRRISLEEGTQDGE